MVAVMAGEVDTKLLILYLLGVVVPADILVQAVMVL
jgi:hypothetical protein